MKFPHVFDGVLYNTVSTLLLGMVIFSFTFNWCIKVDLSYGFYLYHMVWIKLALHLGFVTLEPAWNDVVLITCIVTATILSAWISNQLVEKNIKKLMM